jgi:hypothetical protein
MKNESSIDFKGFAGETPALPVANRRRAGEAQKYNLANTHILLFLEGLRSMYNSRRWHP